MPTMAGMELNHSANQAAIGVGVANIYFVVDPLGVWQILRYAQLLARKWIVRPADRYPIQILLPCRGRLPKMLSKLGALRQTAKLKAIYCHAFNITLHQEEISNRLISSEGLLNDKIIDVYFALLSATHLQSAGALTCFSFSTYFYSTFAQRGYEAVSRWAKKVKLFLCDTIFVPVHLTVDDKGHWCLVSIHPKAQIMYFYDSLQVCQEAGENCFQNLLNYLQEESNSHYDGRVFDRSKWRTEFREDIPLQDNGFDCGVYICQFAKTLSMDTSMRPKINLNKDIVSIRKEMAIEIRDLKITSPQTIVEPSPNAMENLNTLATLPMKCSEKQKMLTQMKPKRQPKVQPEKKVLKKLKQSPLKENKKVQTATPEEDELSDDFEPSKSKRKCKKKVECDEDVRQRPAWDIQGIHRETCSILEQTLPLDFNYKIVAVQPIVEETEDEDDEIDDSDVQPVYRKNKSLPKFTAVVRLDIRSKDEALDWLEHYEGASFSNWRATQTFKENTPQIVFKKHMRCHHDTRASNPSSKTKKPHQKHTSCQAKIIITVKNFNMKGSTDELLGTYPCVVRIRHWHNHRLMAVKSLKHRRPTREVKKKFHDMFQTGYSPSSALLTHKFDLKVQHGENFYQAEADGAQCPSIKWCYYQYYKIFKKEYGANYGPDMIEKLKALIAEYNESCGKICAKMHQEGEDLVVVICSPLMQRVHELLRSSGEIVFMDFSGGLDRYNSRVGCLGTPSVAGGLPLGVMICSSETEILITKGLKMLQEIYPKGKAFFGSDTKGPQIFMTDDSTPERNSLKNLYPFAILLLCIFHLLQAFLRYVTDSEHKVKKSDRCLAIDMLKSLVYASTEEELEERYKNTMENVIVKDNSILKKHIEEDIYPRAKEWALCHRQGLMTRGNNTNNYMETMILQLKGIVFQRVKAFNNVQLFDFLTTRLDGYIESRIASVLNERNPFISLKYRPVAADKLEDLVATKVSDTIFRVTNKKTGGDYVVDTELSLCNCFKGNTGAQCKHQYIVAKNFNIATQQFYEFMDANQKMALHRIMTGSTQVPAGWYADLLDVTAYTENEVEQGIETSNNCVAFNENVETDETDKNVKTDETDKNNQAVTKCKERLKVVFERFMKALDNKPDESLKPLEQFCSTVEAKKTDSAMLSALYHMKNFRRQGKYMNVNTEALRRRKTRLMGRKAQQTGRTPKANFAQEHAYSQIKTRPGPMNPAPPKRKAKAPNTFAQRVDMLRMEPAAKIRRK